MTTFREQQRVCGFDTNKIEHLKRVARGASSAPCNERPALAVVPAPMTTGAMLKRADGSLMKHTGLGYTTIFKLERDGKFPARRQLSPGRVGWLTSEVDAWLLSSQRAVKE